MLLLMAPDSALSWSHAPSLHASAADSTLGCGPKVPCQYSTWSSTYRPTIHPLTYGLPVSGRYNDARPGPGNGAMSITARCRSGAQLEITRGVEPWLIARGRESETGFELLVLRFKPLQLML